MVEKLFYREKEAISNLYKNITFRRIMSKFRSRFYNLFYNIGTGCCFEKIRFRKPSVGKMGRKSIFIGNKVTIYEDTVLTAINQYPILIGNSSFINQRCLIGPGVTIGENVSLGHQVSLITVTHKMGDTSKRAGETIFKEISIGNGSWLGANATVLPGVSIGSGCIIAAGSVVTRNCEPNSLYGGVPAKLIKKL